MTILQEIFKWSKGCPKWQQDAIARLYQKRQLSDEDYDDLYALLKSEHGITDAQGRIPKKIDDEQVVAPNAKNRLVQLVAIKNLRNVNALAEDQRLPISPVGLSVIYGENGTGKSGYSRVFKKACRARDQREPIHPNAHIANAKAALPQATFELIVDGQPLEVEWKSSVVAPEQLSSIAIFDAHCARAYVDNQGDFAYVPYGLDILEGLVNVCTRLREMAAKEQAENLPKLELFTALAAMQTQAGNLVSTLSGKTKPEEVEKLSTLSEAEHQRLAMLTTSLAETDPKQKAQILRLRATRFTSLSKRIGPSLDAISNVKVGNLKSLIDKSSITKQAAILAGQQFRETPGLLNGTGGEVWKALFDAARAFSIESHPDMTFPELGPEALCPLCQNTLETDGAARLEAFETFYQQAAEKADKAARKVAIDYYRVIEQFQLDLQIDEALAKELEEANQKLADDCTGLQKILLNRRSSILKATEPEQSWDTIPVLPDGLVEFLDEVKEQLLTEAKALEDSMDEKAKGLLISEKAELDTRLKLNELKVAVLESIDKFRLEEKLKKCSVATVATSISRKSTELSKTMATQEVADALNSELKKLNVHELKVIMKPESPKGKTEI